MKRSIIAILMVLVLAVPAFAVEPDLRGLTEEQRAELALTAAKMKKDSNLLPNVTKAVEKSTPEKANEWVQVGANISTALITAAEKLGIAADKFLDSKSGKLVVILIVWKVMGSALVHLVIGVSFWILATSILFYFYRRTVISKVTYTPVEGKARRKKEVVFRDPTEIEGTSVFFAFLWALATVVSLATVFTA